MNIPAAVLAAALAGTGYALRRAQRDRGMWKARYEVQREHTQRNGEHTRRMRAQRGEAREEAQRLASELTKARKENKHLTRLLSKRGRQPNELELIRDHGCTKMGAFLDRDQAVAYLAHRQPGRPMHPYECVACVTTEGTPIWHVAHVEAGDRFSRTIRDAAREH